MNQTAMFDLTDYGDDLDFWSTPRAAWQPMLPILAEHCAMRCGVHVVEPAAGEGALLEMVRELPSVHSLTAIEIHAKRAAACADAHPHATVHTGDFLTMDVARWHPKRIVDYRSPLVIVQNPPYTNPRETIGLEFVLRALELVEASRGIVCALLPHDWATSVRWSDEVHRKNPGRLHPLRTRPKFNGAGSGLRPVSWFLWDLLNPTNCWWPIG